MSPKEVTFISTLPPTGDDLRRHRTLKHRARRFYRRHRLRDRLYTRFVNWTTFRDVRAEDPGVARSGDRFFIDLHTRARFKPCIVAEVNRNDLTLLAGMIRDILADAPETGNKQ